MKPGVFLSSVCLLAASGALGPETPAAPAPGALRQAAAPDPAPDVLDVTGILDEYCVTCHGGPNPTGGLALDRLDASDVSEDPAAWEEVVRKLRAGSMPPPRIRRPDGATYDAVASRLESELDRTGVSDPGRPALRRLNRAEYANAIRDLLDLEVDVESLLPPDDAAFGFDNIGDLLVVSPALLERYLGAADRVSALAVGDPSTPPGSETYRNRGDQSQARHLDGQPLGTVGGIGVKHLFPLDGEYEFRLTLFRTNLELIRGLEHSHELEITVDGERLFFETVGGEAEAGREGATVTERSDAIDAGLRVRAPVRAGPHRVSAAFLRKTGAGTNRLRPFERSNSGTYDSTGRPHLETLTILGPFGPTGNGDTPSRRRIFSCRPGNPDEEEPCAEEILSTIARRAYRRPLTAADLDRLLPFYREGRRKGTFETGIQLALRRILASPSFVFRIENDPSDIEPGLAHPVSDIELASRLAFFLWSSIPDDTLLELAANNRLRDPATLESEVRRMLADARADALVENFAGQWLHLRNLDNISPNSDEFPDFDNDLRQAFRREAELFFASILREDRSVLDLLTADYTFVNERLARHYGIPNVYGSGFRRVRIGPELDARRGLLGKGGILMATSHADRTAPVLRGKWIMENLLGTPPPPPPPNVPPLESPPEREPRTLRERMELHRTQPACASCHELIDPLGFAMENLDAIGKWRTHEDGIPIDASGRLADGTSVDGVAELRDKLLEDPNIFTRTLTEKLLVYALGRGLQYYDMPVVRGIIREAESSDYRFSSIVLGIARSVPFQMRSRTGNRDDPGASAEVR